LSPEILPQDRHYHCRKSEEEISKALHSNERADFIFGLKQEYKRYKFYKLLISECDEKISEYLTNHIEKRKLGVDIKQLEKKPYMRKKTIKGIDLNIVSNQFFGGVDLFAIPGVSHSTVLTIMSELEENGFKKFNTAKQFTSWLRLVPNNKISGGKMLSHRAPKGNGRLKIALRNAANSI